MPDDCLAGGFGHFLAAVIREGGLVAVWGRNFEVAAFTGLEDHALSFQPSSEFAEFHHLASWLGFLHGTTFIFLYNTCVLFFAKPDHYSRGRSIARCSTACNTSQPSCNSRVATLEKRLRSR